MTDDRWNLLESAPPLNFIAVGSDWRERAACHNHPQLPPETWDDSVEGQGRERHVRIQAASNVCMTECPVVEACAAAVDLRWDSGVRAGTDLRDVRAARRIADARRAARRAS